MSARHFSLRQIRYESLISTASSRETRAVGALTRSVGPPWRKPYEGARRRQLARRCRDDRPGRREGQQLQHQGRAVDHLAPAATVAALAHPAPPELEGLRQQLGADEPRLHQPGVAITLDLAQDERRWLAGVQQELGGDPRALARQRKAADQRDAHDVGLKHRTPAFQSDLLPPPHVVESWLAFEQEAH